MRSQTAVRFVILNHCVPLFILLHIVVYYTNQLPGERNYHIFYQLCSGASAALKQELAIEGGADSFYLLTGGDCTAIAGVDDIAAFSSLQVRYQHFS
jgi:Myosin head (motor domain)